MSSVPGPSAPRLEEHSGPVRPGASGWAFRLRVASGILFVPLLILLARVGGPAFLLLVALQVLIGLVEFFRMMRSRGLTPERELGIAGGVLLVVAAYAPDRLPPDLVATGVLMVLMIAGLLRPRPRAAESLAVTALGVLYVGWLSAHEVLLRELPWRAGTSYADGGAYVLLAFFLPWSCDTFAYLVGRQFGRIRPWKTISPRKSLEGAIGGFVAAVGAAFVARAWFAKFLSPLDALVLGVMVGVLAQAGDLVESLLKREAQHGDSSDLIPGHGGVLDRFDSVLFSAPVVYYYLRFAVFHAP